jgi:hypothetical protein
MQMRNFMFFFGTITSNDNHLVVSIGKLIVNPIIYQDLLLLFEHN